jgi:ATPase subunit of ABC transporter with duplicated ATPase domains
MDTTTFDQLLSQTLQGDIFGETGVLKATLETPASASKVLVVYGDNGCGKSYFIKDLAKRAHASRVVPLQLSMAYRTRSGMEKAMMYGNESAQSTGLTSIGVLERAISSMRGWDTQPHLALLDEPDTGLADRYRRAMGEFIADFALEPPAGTLGVVVVTHSRRLIEGLLCRLKGADRVCSILQVGGAYSGLDAFLRDDAHASVTELLALDEVSTGVRRAIRQVEEARTPVKASFL